MSKPNFMQECYKKYVTPETREKVENMTDEECGIIFINKKD